MLTAGRANLNRPPQGAADKVGMQSDAKAMSMVSEELAWPALLRKLDRIDPSFRH